MHHDGVVHRLRLTNTIFCRCKSQNLGQSLGPLYIGNHCQLTMAAT